jgi:hypothetical protein
VLWLAKLERYQRVAWEQILLPNRRLPDPSVLRTHPPMNEPIARLERLSGAPPRPPLPQAARPIEAAWPVVHVRAATRSAFGTDAALYGPTPRGRVALAWRTGPEQRT